MVTRIINYLKFLKKVNIKLFFHLNYFCDAVIRLDNSKIIPYKNAVVDLDPGCKIYISGGDIEIGCDKLKKSKEETRVRLRKNAVWGSDGGARISYGTTLELLTDALFNSKFFTINSNCTMVIAKRADFGKDVMIARNVILYDSDFHQLLDNDDNIINYSDPLTIGNHVWIGANSMILKGANIGSGSMIGANTVVTGNVPHKTMFYQKNVPVIRENYGTWNREKP